MLSVSTPVAFRTVEAYHVSTSVYEGPLDLLLELIERAELDITTLALAQVTDQYLSRLAEIKDRDPDEVSAFIVIAARLVQIKSAALLPRPSQGEIISEIDDAEALAQQLILYRRFKQLAAHLSERDLNHFHTYLRIAPPPYRMEPQLDLGDITLESLIAAARRVLSNPNQLTNLDEVVTLPRVTIREQIDIILGKLKLAGKTSFQSILHSKTRVEVVVTFLALLELVKRHIVAARQETLFADILLDSSENWQPQDDFEVEFRE
ncbi:MAG: segregation/condensation protein A [Anaerolineaceae bacterium]|nr:segregation/condensation protein A [Anaerolineaceae bacterium]